MHLPQSAVGGVALSAFSLVCAIVATAIDYWYVAHGDGVNPISVNTGIWEICRVQNGHDEACITISEAERAEKLAGVDADFDWWRACEALMVLAIMALATATIIPIIPNVRKIVAAVAAGTGGMFCILAVVIFAAKYDETRGGNAFEGNYHAGFAMACIASAAGLIAAVLFCLSKEEE